MATKGASLLSRRVTPARPLSGYLIRAPIVFVLTLLIAFPVLTGVVEAHEQGDIWAWRSCTFRSNEAAGQQVIVRNDGSYPGNAQNPAGVTNSFRDRMVDASGQWTVQMQVNGITSTVQFLDGVGSNDILIRQRNLAGGTLGVTSRTALGGGNLNCPVHGAADTDIYQSIIDTDIRDTWFTQDNSRRATWEGCPNADDYTCSKTQDFGGMLTHELGHALGIAHPNEADTHNGGGTRAMDAARCGNAATYNTMCPTQFQYRTAWRTLDDWDVETLRRLYANN